MLAIAKKLPYSFPQLAVKHHEKIGLQKLELVEEEYEDSHLNGEDALATVLQTLRGGLVLKINVNVVTQG